MIIKGDVNFDGEITAVDELLALGGFAGLFDVYLTDEQQNAADINSNGSIDTDDIKAIREHLSGRTIINEVI